MSFMSGSRGSARIERGPRAGAGAPLEAAVAPADHLARGQPVDDPLDQAVLVFEPLVGDALGAQEPFDGGRVVRLPPRGVLHHEAPGMPEDPVVAVEGRADG